MSRAIPIVAACFAATLAACSGLKPPSTAQGSAAASAPAAPPERTPEGLTGNELVVNDCVMCHDARLLQQQRLSAAQWAKSLDKMRTWGAPTEPDDLGVLGATLPVSSGSGAGPFAPGPLPVAEAAGLFASQPDGPLADGHADHGAELYDYQCVSCHQKDGLGGPQGVAVAGRLILDRAPDFARVVRSGRGGMPDFSDMSDADMADLLAYLRSLP